MSTPVVAGNAAMARQYFREGWYNTGSKNLTAGFEPSAALLKAALINSAVGMSFAGVNPDASALDITLDSPPDIHQVGAVRVFFTWRVFMTPRDGLSSKHVRLAWVWLASMKNSVAHGLS